MDVETRVCRAVCTTAGGSNHWQRWKVVYARGRSEERGGSYTDAIFVARMRYERMLPGNHR